jgi:simple sugar transport system permease protein
MTDISLVSGVSVAFLTSLFGATVTAATPLIFAALGETVAERAGMLNLGVEGIMLMSALGSFIVTLTTGSLLLGFVAAVLIGVLAGLLHGFLSISLNADQVISGLMITLLGAALTAFVGVDWSNRSVDGLQPMYFPLVGEPLSAIPVVGRGLFFATPTDFLALGLVPVVWYLLFETDLGREIIAVGEDPEAADTLGVSVFRIRYAVTIFGGALAGLAGGHLILAWINQWSNGMTSGLGWIDIALVIVSRWRPFWVFFVAYLFSLINALQIRIQALELGDGIVGGLLLDPAFMATYPYIATIIVLALASRNELNTRLGRPGALAVPYKREE